MTEGIFTFHISIEELDDLVFSRLSHPQLALSRTMPTSGTIQYTLNEKSIQRRRAGDVILKKAGDTMTESSINPASMIFDDETYDKPKTKFWRCDNLHAAIDSI